MCPISSVWKFTFEIIHAFVNMPMYEQLNCMSDYIPKSSWQWRPLKANVSISFVRKDALDAVVEK